MRYRVTHETRYRYSEPVELAQNMLHLRPREMPRQRVGSHALSVTPKPVGLQEHTDYFGNHVTPFALERPHREMTVTGRSEVEVVAGDMPLLALSPAWETVRDGLTGSGVTKDPALLEVCQYAFDSELAAGLGPGLHAMREYAEASFTPGRPLLIATDELCQRIFREFKYDPNATTISTPLAEVMAARAGVCQDFAHLMIGMLRAQGLPARYVSGYLRTFRSAPHTNGTHPSPSSTSPETEADAKPAELVGADASHAWLSVYCPGPGWVDFDPTNGLMPGETHITVAWGRDYSDVSPVRGVILGGGESQISVAVEVTPLSATP